MDLTKTGKVKRIAAGKDKRLNNPGMMLRRRSGLAERVRVRAREMHVPTGSVAGAARAVALKLPIGKIVMVFGLIALASLGVLIGVNAYAKSRQITIRLENGIAPQMITTTARTVGELLEQNHIQTGASDSVSPAPNTRLTDGMTVMIMRAMVVYITDKDQTKQIYMTGGTVGDALTEAGIAYDRDLDDITPGVNSKLTSGICIKHVAVTSEILQEYQYIEYSTQYKSSAALLKGRTQVVQSGKQGVKTKQIRVIYKDGVEFSRTELSNMVTQAPISRIILKGAGVPQRAAANPGKSGGKSGGTTPGGNSGGHSDDDDDKEVDLDGSDSGRYADIKPEDLAVPSVPSSFDSIVYMQITAYTHTGRHTARGGWPQYTRTYDHPGTIAVDSKAIPYGTLLYVTGYGYCLAEDTGSNTVDSSKMGDVFMNTKAECNRWGRKRNVTVYIVKYDYKRQD